MAKKISEQQVPTLSELELRAPEEFYEEQRRVAQAIDEFLEDQRQFMQTIEEAFISGRAAKGPIVTMADDALEKNTHLSDDKKVKLRAARDKFQERMKAFAEAQSIDDEVRRIVVSAILCAAIIGSIAGDPGSVEQLIRSVREAQKREQAQRARDAKKATAPKVNEPLLAAIREEAEALKRGLANSDKFAEQVKPGVSRRLGLKVNTPGKTTTSAIRRAVRKSNQQKDR